MKKIIEYIIFRLIEAIFALFIFFDISKSINVLIFFANDL